MMAVGNLTFFCGKMGAGKSTRASALALESNAVLISEDEWLATIYPNLIASLQDYKKYSDLLKPQIKNLTQSILHTGTNVVLDFPANTVEQRKWLKSISEEIGACHKLIFIDTADIICLQHIQQRRMDQPERAATDTPEMFAQMAKFFTPPGQEEGLDVYLMNNQEKTTK